MMDYLLKKYPELNNKYELDDYLLYAVTLQLVNAARFLLEKGARLSEDDLKSEFSPSIQKLLREYQ